MKTLVIVMQTFWVGMLCMIITTQFKLRPAPWQLFQPHTSTSRKMFFIQFLQLNTKPVFEIRLHFKGRAKLLCSIFFFFFQLCGGNGTRPVFCSSVTPRLKSWSQRSHRWLMCEVTPSASAEVISLLSRWVSVTLVLLGRCEQMCCLISPPQALSLPTNVFSCDMA